MENSGIHTLTPSVEQVESTDRFTLPPSLCHAIRGIGYSEGRVESRVLGWEFEILIQMLFLNSSRLIPGKGVLQALSEVIELGYESFNYSLGCFSVFEDNRLFEDRQRFCTGSRLPSKPHQAFWVNTSFEQVFEELIERVIGIAHHKDCLSGRAVENLSNQRSEKRLAVRMKCPCKNESPFRWLDSYLVILGSNSRFVLTPREERNFRRIRRN